MNFLAVATRSIFGLVDIYNLLPQDTVDAIDVDTFQAKLQGTLKTLAVADVRNFEVLYSTIKTEHSIGL